MKIHLIMVCNFILFCCLASCNDSSDQDVHQPDETTERAAAPLVEQNIVPHDLVLIAGIGGTDDDTQGIITQELNEHSIEVYFEGSVVYDVQVQKKDAKKASEILRGLDALKDKWIKHVDLESGSFLDPDDEK